MIDIVIIGAGPAGLTAGMYAARAGLSATVVELLFPGGQIATTARVENYPGFPGGIGGAELAANLHRQAEEFGVDILNATPQALDLAGKVKTVRADGRTIEARAAVLCMGATPRLLNVPGEARLRGAGVSYCATCDGNFFRNRRVAIVGGGDTAAEDAVYLAQVCSEVLLIHRREAMRAQEVLANRALALPNVKPLWNTAVLEILGDGAVSGLRLDTMGEARQEAVDALFVAVGTEPSTQLVRGILDLDENGYILAGEDTRTSLPGVYAAGDIRKKSLRQIVTAVADGAVAIYSAIADF